MKLSFPDDRLPAISGLCKYMDPHGKDEYLVGIWKSSFGNGLGWYIPRIGPITTSTQIPSGMPSWSPFSTGRSVLYNTASEQCRHPSCALEDARLVATEIRPQYEDIHG